MQEDSQLQTAATERCERLTSNGVQGDRWEKARAQYRDQGYQTRVRVAPVMYGVRVQDGALFFVRDLLCGAVEPLLGHDAQGGEPSRVRVQRSGAGMPVSKQRQAMSEARDAQEHIAHDTRR